MRPVRLDRRSNVSDCRIFPGQQCAFAGTTNVKVVRHARILGRELTFSIGVDSWRIRHGSGGLAMRRSEGGSLWILHT